MLYPIIPSQMDINIKIDEKNDPLTILGREIKMQETNRFLPIVGVKDVDPFLEIVETNSELNLKDKIVCQTIDCLVGRRRVN